MYASHSPNWVEVSIMLRTAMEQYRDQHRKRSLAKVTEDLIAYIDDHSGKWLDEKTIRRDMGNRETSKKFHSIPNWRVEIYAKWCYQEAGKNRGWITKWLEYTAYPAPGKLLAEICDSGGNIQNIYGEVKTNVPPLRKRLWGRFLGRREEIEKLIRWADNQRHPIAVLCGFGGNGKTTIQQKVGEEFVYGIKCPLRWPYIGAVWISGVDYPRGQPNLLDVLRKIAETFELFEEQPNLEMIRSDVISKEVKELLQEKRILVLLDNFETVSGANQTAILEFFNNLRGSNQTLISTRYRPDWFLEQEQDAMYSMAHVLIRVNGLSSKDAELLIRDVLSAKSFSNDEFQPDELARLSIATQSNPKAILTVLGLVEQGMFLTTLLDAITAGHPEADRIFDVIIDKAWEDVLSEDDRSVLMAKALFSHSVTDNDLGQVAGVTGNRLRESIKRLGAISFFEFERTRQHTLRIRTHPLAQDFAYRMLQSCPEFRREAEERWWSGYGLNITQTLGRTACDSFTPELAEDAENVVAHMIHHFAIRSPYYHQAAHIVGERGGLGYALRRLGKWDDLLLLSEPVLNFAIEQQEPQLLGVCALFLISGVYRERGEFEQAEKYAGLAVEYNATLQDPWLGAVIERGRAGLYWQRGYFKAAEQSYQQALRIFQANGDTYDVAETYIWLGGVTLDLVTASLENATDRSEETQKGLQKAEHYLDESEKYFHEEIGGEDIQYLRSFYLRSYRDAWKGLIARVRGDFNLSQDLLQGCIEHFPSLFGLARLYRELALIEHLLGHKELAYSYEEKGLYLFKGLGVLDKLTPYQCYRIIDRMKREGVW